MMNRTAFGAAALLLALTLGSGGAANAQGEARKNLLLDAKTWAFQLKNLGPDQQAKIAASPFDLVVIDSANFLPDDNREYPLTPAELERMKKKPDGSRRLVIAYFSVGETENYRNYWKPEWNTKRPAWMGKENKQWPGNYLAHYWNPTWQNIIMGGPDSFADRVINSGFDGFYIDRVDAYYYFGDTTAKRDEMASFIVKLANYIRSKKPDAMILSQNAEELLDRPAYVRAIDGIAKEDLIFGISHAEKINPADDISHTSRLLTSAKNAGKAIFVIEYLKQLPNIQAVLDRTKQLGYVLYVGPRGLGSLVSGSPEAILQTGVVPVEENAGDGQTGGAAAAPAPAKKQGIIKRTLQKLKG